MRANKKGEKMTIKYHSDASFVSADTIAECYEGVSDELCKRLWASLDAQPDPLDSFECDDIVHWKERNAIANTWDFFTDEEKIEINQIIKENND